MNKKFSSSLLKNFVVGLCFFPLFSFISCDNFLKANEVASEIKAHIEYANAPSSSVLLQSDESMGTFIAGDSKDFKIGYDTEIYFSANIQNCILDYLVAQSATDASKDMSEYIKIEIVERDDEKGFYKIIVKVLKQAPDIIIKPVCIPFPVVVSYTPKNNSEPSFANASITVTFNMPMEDEDTFAAQSFFTYKNIFITHNDADISKYFEAPKFNSEKTVLTLTPKKTFLDYIKSTNEISIKINVFFNDEISVKKHNRNLFLKQDENTSFSVSYKPQFEDIPPIPNGFGFFASNKEYALEDLSNKTKTDISNLEIFTQDEIAIKGNTPANEYEQKVLQNRTDGTLYIYGRYIDQDSGISKISVTKYYAYDKKGSILQEEKFTNDYFIDKEYQDVSFSKQDKNILFKIKCDLPENTENPDDDGAYNFLVQVYDACDNASAEQTFTVFKAYGLDISNLKVFNIYNNIETNESRDRERQQKVVEYFNDDTYDDVIKTIKFVYTNPIYSVVGSTGDTDFTIKYTDKSGKQIEAPVPASQDNKKYYEYTLDLDHVYDQSFIIIAKNKYGKTQSRTFYFPPKPQKYSDGNYIVIPINAKITNLIATFINAENKMIYESQNYGYYNEINTSCNDLYVLSQSDTPRSAIVCYENELLFSECCDDPISERLYNEDNGPDISGMFEVDSTIPIPNVTDSNDEIVTGIKNIECTVNGSDFNFTITLEDDVWTNHENDWDFIYAIQYVTDYTVFPVMFFPKGTLTATKTLDYIPSNTKYRIFGLKGNKRSEYSSIKEFNPSEQTIELLQEEQLANMAPSLENGIYNTTTISDFEYIGYNKYGECFVLNNAKGLIDNYQITVNNSYRYTFNKKYVSKTNNSLIIDADDGNIFLPVFDWSSGNNIIDVTVSNKNGSYSKSVEFKLDKSPIEFSAPDFQSRPITRFNLESKPTTFDIDTALNGEYDSGSNVYISYLTNKGWKSFGRSDYSGSHKEKIGYIEKSGSEGAYTYNIHTDEDFYTAHGDIPADTFIKISTILLYGEKRNELLFFNGKPSSGNVTDILLDMGDYFLVSSDQPVYMNTLATKKAYSECCNWTAEEWEELRFKTNEKLLPFSKENSNLMGMYETDTSWMQSGDCYVVIAHFADGHTKMSEVKVK